MQVIGKLPQAPAQLPATLSALPDYPYRSLAGWLAAGRQLLQQERRRVLCGICLGQLAGPQDGLGRRHSRHAAGTAGRGATASLQPRGQHPARLPRQGVQEAVRGVGIHAGPWPRTASKCSHALAFGRDISPDAAAPYPGYLLTFDMRGGTKGAKRPL